MARTGLRMMAGKFFFTFMAAIVPLFAAFSGEEVRIEGRVKEASLLPEAKKSAYPDCNYTVLLETTAGEIVLVLPGFRQYRNVREPLNGGEFIQADVVPFDTASEQIRRTQIADAIDQFELPYFWSPEPVKISKLTGLKFQLPSPPPPVLVDIGSIPLRSGDNIQIAWGTASAPAADDSRTARMAAMAADRAEILSYESCFSSMEEWKNKYNAVRLQSIHRYQRFQPGWFENTYLAGAPLPPLFEMKNFFSNMQELNRLLKERGVDLILIYVPNKAEISADVLNPDAAYVNGIFVNPLVREIQQACIDSDIEFIDPTQRMIRERQRFPFLYWYSVPGEYHPAEGAIRIVTEVLAERLMRYPEIAEAKKAEAKFHFKPGTSRYRKDFVYPAGKAEFPAGEPIQFPCLYDSANRLVEAGEGTSSSVLVLGNSYIAYPGIRDGASVSHYLAHCINLMPDTLYRDGIFGLGRFMVQKGKPFYENRRVVIYPLTPYIFGDWLPTLPRELNAKVTRKVMQFGKGGKDWSTVGMEPQDGFEARPDGSLLIKPSATNRGGGGTLKISIPESAGEKIAVTLNITSRAGRTFSKLSFNGTSEIVMIGEKHNVLKSAREGDNILTVEFVARVSTQPELYPTVLESLEIYKCE